MIRQLVPPIVFSWIRKLKNRKYGWKGNYSTWQEAQRISTGYDTDEILQKVRASLLKVKKGEAVYERDSVLFDKIQYDWLLLSSLLMTAACHKGRLSVLDFGGSLGSTYFQNKKFLDQLNNVTWSIVEQKHFVDVGKNDFEGDKLHFYHDAKTCIKEQNPNILLLSSVLQYVESPYEILDDIFKHHEFPYVIISRTTFNTKDENKISLQIIPPSIYNASYPSWLFSRSEFAKYFQEKKYALIEESDLILNQPNVDLKGMIFKKIN